MNKLTWDNFKGKPDNSNNKAITCSTVYSKYETLIPNRIIINVRACFIKKESWKKDKHPSEYHLNHEQKHFDIAELFARKLRKILTDSVFQTEAIARKEIPRIIRENNKTLNLYQDLYDKETNHSINKEQQGLWDVKIDKELNELEAYSSAVIDIRVR